MDFNDVVIINLRNKILSVKEKDVSVVTFVMMMIMNSKEIQRSYKSIQF